MSPGPANTPPEEDRTTLLTTGRIVCLLFEGRNIVRNSLADYAQTLLAMPDTESIKSSQIGERRGPCLIVWNCRAARADTNVELDISSFHFIIHFSSPQSSVQRCHHKVVVGENLKPVIAKWRQILTYRLLMGELSN